MADVFKTYEAAKQWLFYELPKTSDEIFKGEVGLEKMRCILTGFDNPQDNYPTVHIAGTSGKGTTAKLITDALVLSGKNVGTVMSPHVYDLRERFLVNGEFVSKSEVKSHLERLHRKFSWLNEEGIYPTYFEATLLLAYQTFENRNIDYLVVETGLGGLLDGTNLINRRDKLAVITQIGLDHTDILGDTLEKIAAQKAGIITEGIEVIALDQDSAINAAIAKVAQVKQANLRFIQPSIYKPTNPRLIGEHQQGNITLAMDAVRILATRDHWEFKEDCVDEVIHDFTLPGRFELRRVQDKQIILDGAHNSQKLSALVATIKKVYPNKKFSVVFGGSRSRKLSQLLEILRPIAKEFVFTTYSARKSDTKRAANDFSGSEIEGIESTVLNQPKAVISYIKESKSDNWLVTGSFYVASEIGQLLS